MALIVRPKLAKLNKLPKTRENKINAYCKVSYDKICLLTKPHLNSGANADWSDELTFDNYNQGEMMWIEVMHQQAPHDVLLGRGILVIKSLNLIPFARKPFQITLLEAGPQQSQVGKVTLSIQYKPSDIEMHLHQNNPIPISNVQIVPEINNIQIPIIHQSVRQGEFKRDNNMQVSSAASNMTSLTDSQIFYTDKQQIKPVPINLIPPINKINFQPQQSHINNGNNYSNNNAQNNQFNQLFQLNTQQNIHHNINQSQKMINPQIVGFQNQQQIYMQQQNQQQAQFQQQLLQFQQQQAQKLKQQQILQMQQNQKNGYQYGNPQTPQQKNPQDISISQKIQDVILNHNQRIQQQLRR